MILEFQLLGPRCVGSPRISARLTKPEGADGIKLTFTNDQIGDLKFSLSATSCEKLSRALSSVTMELVNVDEWEPES